MSGAILNILEAGEIELCRLLDETPPGQSSEFILHTLLWRCSELSKAEPRRRPQLHEQRLMSKYNGSCEGVIILVNSQK